MINIRNQEAFTLVELMITLAMTGIIVAAVYSTYTIQQRTYNSQDQVAVMQQNIRAGLSNMVKELRMAGYDPQFNSGATITAAAVNGITFTMDLNENGTLANPSPANPNPNETITYGFQAADDANGDGVVDNASRVASLRRNSGGGLQPLAENIQAIEFLYTYADGTTTTAPGAVGLPLTDIRSVTISILARSNNKDSRFINKAIYIPASGVMWDLNGAGLGTGQPTNDKYRRRLLTTTVQCRNMGI